MDADNPHYKAQRVDKVLARNLLIFSVILTFCVGSLGYALLNGSKKIQKSDEWVEHTYKVILEAEELATLIEGMLASQRGYILTGKQDFLDQYNGKKTKVFDRITNLYELSNDNESQRMRLDKLRVSVREYSKKLEERAERYKPAGVNAEFLNEVEAVYEDQAEILGINAEVLQEEYALLNQRLKNAELRRDQYISRLLIGGIVEAILLFLLNVFLFHAQSKRSSVEQSLRATQERFALAIEGTNDGIFDWDLKNDEVFYSRQFFGLLGYNRPASVGSVEEFQSLVHEEDLPKVLQYIDCYLRKEIPEYSNTFRMRHESGRWVWVNSRAKAIFDNKGKATRMVGANTDITYMKEYQERLVEEKQLAEQANLAKSDFLAHMSHEIRTPLAAISGIAEIFQKDKDVLNEKQQKLVQTLTSSTSSLKDLVIDILDFSKIESGEIELERQDFPLADIFQQVISIMAVNANAKGLAFNFGYAGLESETFCGDKIRMRQILINLIGNAIKFTAKGSVNITAVKTENNGRTVLEITVKDSGIGVEPEHTEIIFERFRQADSSVSRKFGGTGLGLPISRDLARLMGGDITVKSTPGHGSAFTLVLPFRELVKDGGEVSDPALNKKLNEKIKAAMDGEKRALVVEDYEGNVVVVGYILEELGCPYDTAKTGLEGLNLWKQNHYDFILMDIQMPEMDGFTATSEIRRIEREQGVVHTPIIGMTAHALVGDKDKCIQAGMDAYLPKPLVEADLKMQILKFINHKKRAA